MGAWGYGPFDNDDAMDWFSPIYKKIESALKAKGRYGFDEARAAAGLMVSTGMGGPVLAQKAVNALEDALADEEWMNRRDKPDRVRKSIRDDLAVLKRVAARR